MKFALVLNGDIPNVIDGEKIVCCDGGYDRLKKLNIEPDILLGDMDSVSVVPNREIIKFKPEKDATDGELALDYCLENGATEINFYGVFGGRPDHVEGNYCVMYKAFLQGIKIKGQSDKYTMYFASSTFKLSNVKNKTLSVVPFLDKVHINGEKGLKYPMDDLTIYREQARGISNVALQDDITINIDNGVALIFIIE